MDSENSMDISDLFDIDEMGDNDVFLPLDSDVNRITPINQCEKVNTGMKRKSIDIDSTQCLEERDSEEPPSKLAMIDPAVAHLILDADGYFRIYQDQDHPMNNAAIGATSNSVLVQQLHVVPAANIAKSDRRERKTKRAERHNYENNPLRSVFTGHGFQLKQVYDEASKKIYP